MGASNILECSSCTDLLNYLGTQDITSTFFVVGSRAISYPDVVQAEILGGHQVHSYTVYHERIHSLTGVFFKISVHTWSHPNLTTRERYENFLSYRLLTDFTAK